MIWFDENPQLLVSVEAGKHLSSKIEKFDPNNGTKRMSIICQNKSIAKVLIHSFGMLHDKFQDISIRFGWFSNESHNLTEVFDDETIFIGHNGYCASFEKVFDTNTCKISRIARDRNINIGFQRHFCNHSNPRSISLGDLKNRMHHVDPLVRSAEGIFYYLDAIRKQESFIGESYVCGLTLHDASLIARYAGMSQTNKLVYFNIGDDELKEDTGHVVALLTWYYLEGAINKNIETLDHKNNHTYMVANPYFDNPVTFVKTNITGRWWYQHPVDKYFVPCTEEDYITISEGKIPDNFVLAEVD